MAFMFRLTVDKDMVAGTDKSNYPLLVDDRVANFPSSFFSNVVDASGLDIRYYSDAAKSVEYSREIVTVDTTAQTFESWVQIPLLSASSDSTFYCEVGDATSANDFTIWDSQNHYRVFHLQDASDSGTLHDPLIVNNASSVSSKIQKGYDFSGTTHHLQCTTNPDFQQTYPFYISSWVNLRSLIVSPTFIDSVSCIFSREVICQTTLRNWIAFNFGIDSSQRLSWMCGENLSGCVLPGQHTDWYTSDNTVSLNQWIHVGAYIENLYTATPNRVVKLFVDGSQIPSTEGNLGDIVNYHNTHNLAQLSRIGAGYRQTGIPIQNFDGIIDEVRIVSDATIYSNGDWQQTEFNNQNDPSTYILAPDTTGVYFINAAGSSTYPYDTEAKGAVNLKDLLDSVSLNDGDIIEVSDAGGTIDDSAASPGNINASVTIRSYSGNTGNPTFKVRDSSYLFLFNGVTVDGVYIQNIDMYKAGTGSTSIAFIWFLTCDISNFEVTNCNFSITGTAGSVAAVELDTSDLHGTSRFEYNTITKMSAGLYIRDNCSVFEDFSASYNTYNDISYGSIKAFLLVGTLSTIQRIVVDNNYGTDSGLTFVFMAGTAGQTCDDIKIRNNVINSMDSFHFNTINLAAPTLTNSSVVNNSLFQAGGIFVNNADANLVVANNTLSRGSESWFIYAIQVTAAAGASFNNNNIYGYTNPYFVSGGITYGTSNTQLDPLYDSTSNLHLQAGSPCIKTGASYGVYSSVPTTGYDGTARQSLVCDIGAYETTPNTYFVNNGGSATYPFDTEIKGAVNFNQLLGVITLSNWDTVEVSNAGGTIDDSTAFPNFINAAVTIRSYANNTAKPVIHVKNTGASRESQFRWDNYPTVYSSDAVTIQNLQLYKSGPSPSQPFINARTWDFDTLEVTGCDFSVTDPTGAVSAVQGVYLDDCNINQSFTYQDSDSSGVDGALWITDTTTKTIQGVNISDHIFEGKYLFVYIQPDTLSDATIETNDVGGSILCAGTSINSSVAIRNNVVRSVSSLAPLGIYTTGAGQSVVNNTIRNIPVGGYGIRYLSGGANSYVLNNIVYRDDTVGAATGIETSFTAGVIDYNNVYNFGTPYVSGAVTPGPNSIQVDPIFISSTNLRLQSNSPCIRTGIGSGTYSVVPSVGYDGNPRSSATVDMGAYESLLPSGLFPPPLPIYGNYETPVSLGSGSGYYHKPADYLGQETKGGGAIKLVANSGNVSINGRIRMDGQDGTMTGGAAGGSVWLIGWRIDGTGTISADGGRTQLVSNSGGGSGGYISMWHHKTITYDGTATVDGYDGAGDGKIFIKEIEPILEEPFTGDILNIKWWDTTNSVTIDNELTFDSPNDNYNFPETLSEFNISGKEINVEADYTSLTPDSSQNTAAFLLWVDDLNWAGVARKFNGFFGISSINGAVSVSGVPFDNTNVTFRILKNDSTFTYQFWDATSTPQTIYMDYLPELANSVFKVKLTVDKPPLGDSLRTRYQRLTAFDISNQYLYMDGIPIDQSAVAMNSITGTSHYYGEDFYVDNYLLKWDYTASNFASLAAWGDVVRYQYEYNAPPTNEVTVAFDNVRVYEGVLSNAETTEPVIYVDPNYGSDTCSGRQLDPLKNLFVATAWAKKGSTVVLYDGTHNPTKVSRKDLTIRGAEGSIAGITSKNVQDSTGSNWERDALSFYGSQGIVENVHIFDSSRGIVVENGNYEISRNTITDTSNAVTFVKCDPRIIRNKILDVDFGLDFTSCRIAPYAYANIISNADVAVRANLTTDMTFSCNTFDNDQTHFLIDSSSSIIMSSNNLTYSVMPVIVSTDSWFGSYYNNFYPNTTQYNRTPDDATNNIVANPLYYDRIGKDFHLNTGSPNIGTGSLTYNDYLYDFDGADIRSAEIGAYQYIDSTKITSDYYVSSHGNDYWNFGRQTDPFRTLDRAMVDADSTVRIDGGHYDSFYLNLRSQDIHLNQLYIYLGPEQQFVSYITLDAEDASNKYVPLPSFVAPDDASHVAMNIIGSSAQIQGEDYIVEWGHLVWDTYDLDGFLSAGDTLRVIFYGPLQKKALNNFVLHGHYSNYNQNQAIFVSPSGSDSTDLGGDGTNTGGTGSRDLPYRTISMALSQSNSGDNIVAMAGEYPVFDGLQDRVIVPAFDRTAAVNSSKRVYEDFFAQKDFRAYGTTEYDPTPWEFDYTGNSEVFAGGGFLNFTYDGSNSATATSTFQFTSDFEVRANLRNAVDPITLRVTSPDTTAFISYNESQFTAGVINTDSTVICSAVAHSGDTTESDVFVVEYIPVTSDHTRNKYAELSYIPEGSDCTNLALNVVGGNTQDFGEDFYVQDSKIKWDGMTMDGEIEPGEVLRAVYLDRPLSLAVTASITLENGLFTLKAYDGTWNTLMNRSLVGDYTGNWNVSFTMDTPNEEFSHNCIYGKGYASQFLAIADSFENIQGLDKPLAVSTERRNLVIYEER